MEQGEGKGEFMGRPEVIDWALMGLYWAGFSRPPDPSLQLSLPDVEFKILSLSLKRSLGSSLR